MKTIALTAVSQRVYKRSAMLPVSTMAGPSCIYVSDACVQVSALSSHKSH